MNFANFGCRLSIKSGPTYKLRLEGLSQKILKILSHKTGKVITVTGNLEKCLFKKIRFPTEIYNHLFLKFETNVQILLKDTFFGKNNSKLFYCLIPGYF